MTAHPPPGRDPVCASLETLLHGLEAAGQGDFSTRQVGASVELRFGDFDTIAEDRDIALVRLAGMMISDPRYRAMIVSAIKVPLRES